MPPVGRNREKGQTDKMLQDHNIDFQGIEFAATQSGQNAQDSLAQDSGIRSAHGLGFVLSRESHKTPIGLSNLAIEGVAIQVFQNSPARQEILALNKEVGR